MPVEPGRQRLGVDRALQVFEIYLEGVWCIVVSPVAGVVDKLRFLTVVTTPQHARQSMDTAGGPRIARQPRIENVRGAIAYFSVF